MRIIRLKLLDQKCVRMDFSSIDFAEFQVFTVHYYSQSLSLSD